jgi:DNA-directed RNA polymerase specialized sigma24 family protein
LRSSGARRRREVIHVTRTSSAAPQVDEEVIDLRLAEYVEETLAPLRAGHRTAIELACLHGLTYREVAVHMRIPEGTVKTWIRSALHLLRATAGLDAAETACD